MKTASAIYNGIPRAKGFTLLEAMLALFIFSMAVVALVEAVNATGRTFLVSRREGQVQARLETLLLEATRDPFSMPGQRTSFTEEKKVEEGQVTYVTKRSPLELRNKEDQPLQELYVVTITATWQEEGQSQEVSAEAWVYPPLFAAPSDTFPRP